MTDWAFGHPKPLEEDYIAKDTSGNYGVYGVTRDGRFVNHGPYLPFLDLDSEDVAQLTKDSPFNFKSYEWEDIIRNRVLTDKRYVVGKAEGAKAMWYPTIAPPHGKWIWVPMLSYALGYIYGGMRAVFDILFRWDSRPSYKIPYVNKKMEASRKWTYFRGFLRIYPRKMFLISLKFLCWNHLGLACSGSAEFSYWLPFVGFATFADFPRQTWPKLLSRVTVASMAGLAFLYARRLTYHAEPRITDWTTWRSPHLKYPHPPATDVLDRHILGKLAAEKLNKNLDNYVDYKTPPVNPLKLPHVQRIE